MKGMSRNSMSWVSLGQVATGLAGSNQEPWISFKASCGYPAWTCKLFQTLNQRWGWLDPLQARIRPLGRLREHLIASLSNGTTRTDIFASSASIMKMTGHLDDGFYHALRHQQSRHFKTCRPTFCGKPSWFCCTQWCSSPLRHSSTKNLATVAIELNLPVVEARLVLCRTDSCVSENHATKAYLMRRPTGRSNEMSWRSSSAKISSIRTNNYESKFCLTPLHTFALMH